MKLQQLFESNKFKSMEEVAREAARVLQNAKLVFQSETLKPASEPTRVAVMFKPRKGVSTINLTAQNITVKDIDAVKKAIEDKIGPVNKVSNPKFEHSGRLGDQRKLHIQIDKSVLSK